MLMFKEQSVSKVDIEMINRQKVCEKEIEVFNIH